ncbi:polyprenyl synthetase family protein [Aureimonas populi]|uniref:Polyprenyl synthetase family protein n=1 Tax=Aureimonas populi TaxID=1701758 RepID=A0ABW5CMB7_9HYPH|nr:farnesyl diphosphate synthase [Aureimonas populi]
MDTRGFADRLARDAWTSEAVLERTLSPGHPLVAGAPERLLAAMRHAALAGGKRLRPCLVMESARLFAGPAEGAAQVAAALELLHCYSLVHDDLPAMDDDDMRRGRPTVHKAYDEATAILAGDALLTLSFGLVALAEGIDASARIELVAALSVQAGAGGMVGGQALDLAAETSELSEGEIAAMQAMKTGALLTFACEAGAIVAGARPQDRERLRRFGQTIGLAFQLADDLLDETADAAALGKAAGKDRARGKKTLPALHGIDWTRRRLDALVVEAEAILAPYGERAATLIEAARFVANRTS